MTWDVLTLLAGVLVAWLGGEVFVKGAINLAKWARWPASVIGATVAAFGTSAPELLVAVESARENVQKLSFGDVLGSNVVNVGLVFALALLLSRKPLEISLSTLRRDLSMVILMPILTFVILWDSYVSRIEGVVMALIFIGWLARLVREARAHAKEQKAMSIDQAPEPFGKAVFHGVLGLALLAVAAHLVVDGGRAVALALGWSEFVVGALVIAIATSTPELATTLVARMRGHDEVGLGNILGSNLFNGCFIVAVLALIRPFEVTLGEVAPSLIVGVVTAILIWPGKSGTLGRGRGALLLGIYALYVGYTLMMPAGHA